MKPSGHVHECSRRSQSTPEIRSKFREPGTCTRSLEGADPLDPTTAHDSMSVLSVRAASLRAVFVSLRFALRNDEGGRHLFGDGPLADAFATELVDSRRRTRFDHGVQVTLTAFDMLNADGVQKLPGPPPVSVESRYHSW